MRCNELGFTKENIDRLYQSHLKSAYEANSKHEKPPKYAWEYWYGDRFLFNGLVFSCAFLLDDIEIAKKYAELVVQNCLDLFFGNWRQLPRDAAEKLQLSSEEYALIKTDWMEPFIHGTALALAMGNYSYAQKLASYPSEKCESMMLGGKQEDKYLYLLIAKWIATGVFDQKYADVIGAGKKKAPKMALSVLQCLNDKNEKEYLKAMSQYLSHFKKYEFSVNYLDEASSFIGTILFFLGKHQGFKIEDSKISECPYLITF